MAGDDDVKTGQGDKQSNKHQESLGRRGIMGKTRQKRRKDHNIKKTSQMNTWEEEPYERGRRGRRGAWGRRGMTQGRGRRGGTGRDRSSRGTLGRNGRGEDGKKEE